MVIDFIDEGFRAGVQGYLNGRNRFGGISDDMEYFKQECQHFSQVGYKLSKIISGENSTLTKDWRERYHNFEKWIKQDSDPAFRVRITCTPSHRSQRK